MNTTAINQARILRALADSPRPVNARQVAALAGLPSDHGTWGDVSAVLHNLYRAGLTTRRYLDLADAYAIAPAVQINGTDVIATREQMSDQWRLQAAGTYLGLVTVKGDEYRIEGYPETYATLHEAGQALVVKFRDPVRKAVQAQADDAAALRLVADLLNQARIALRGINPADHLAMSNVINASAGLGPVEAYITSALARIDK